MGAGAAGCHPETFSGIRGGDDFPGRLLSRPATRPRCSACRSSSIVRPVQPVREPLVAVGPDDEHSTPCRLMISGGRGPGARTRARLGLHVVLAEHQRVPASRSRSFSLSVSVISPPIAAAPAALDGSGQQQGAPGSPWRDPRRGRGPRRPPPESSAAAIFRNGRAGSPSHSAVTSWGRRFLRPANRTGSAMM